MQKRKTKNYGQSVTSEQGKARTSAKAGRKNFSKKSAKASSQSQRRKGRASGGKKRQRGRHRAVYNIGDLLTQETIKALKERTR